MLSSDLLAELSLGDFAKLQVAHEELRRMTSGEADDPESLIDTERMPYQTTIPAPEST